MMMASASARWSRSWTAIGAAALAASIAACVSKDGREVQPAGTADTTTAAPATRPTVDNPAAPDSTSGVGRRTGTTVPAGDTLAAHGTTVGTKETQRAMDTAHPRRRP